MRGTSGAQEDAQAAMARLHAMMEQHHPATAAHMRRVGDLAAQIGQQLRLCTTAITQLYWGGRLHDIGKLALNPITLDRPGSLTMLEEHQLMRCPVVGAQIAQLCLADAATILLIRMYREPFASNGLVYGHSTIETSLLAQIVAVADAFDAMTSPRPYQILRQQHAALAELAANAERQWNAAVVAALHACLCPAAPSRRAA